MDRLLRNPGLGVKLNFFVLFVLSIFLVSIVFLLNRTTESLTEQVGGDRVVEEVNILENRLTEVEDNLQVNIDSLVTSISFYQAVGNRNEEVVADIINTANDSLKQDDITVVDGDGKRLIDTAANENTTEEDRLLGVGLLGQKTIALLIEHNGDQFKSASRRGPVVNPENRHMLGRF
jgi:hypothetical protein